MKKVSIIAIITLLIMFSMSGCALMLNGYHPNKLARDGIEPAFKDLPENYTIEQAEKDGCYVRVNSEAVAGVEEWNKFLQDASNQKEASIRIVDVYHDMTSYVDLSYSDGYYRTFKSIAGEVKEQKFKYLLTLSGTFANSQKVRKMTVLADNKDLTFEDVMDHYLSSTYKPEAPFRIIFMR